jgi:TPR repeat protein
MDRSGFKKMRFKFQFFFLLISLLLGFLLSIGQPSFASNTLEQSQQKIDIFLKKNDVVSSIKQSTPEKSQQRVKMVRADAEKGIISAETLLGMLYLEDMNVKNISEGIYWLEKAAKEGDVIAPDFLGLAYETGTTGEKDYHKAYYWLRMAADLGNISSMTRVGYFYYNGMGMLQDYTEAASWYLRAAKKGDTDAQVLIAEMYASGQGVSKDDKESVRWNELAAEQGNAYAQASLAIAYIEGEGVTKDLIKAHMWANVAASKMDKFIGLRQLIEQNMTDEQKAEAQHLAREWLQKKSNTVAVQ